MRQLYEYHPVVGYRYIPRLRVRIPHEGGGYLIQVNEQGFRADRPFARARTPGHRRVLVFGDSFTAGDAVPNRQRYTELLEARLAIEGEACALAALRIDDAQLKQLSDTIDEMRNDNKQQEILKSEEADRRFHELIATSTQNSGIIAAVSMLWDARARSPQSHSMDDKGRAGGLKPPIDEHVAILRALKRRDPDAARAAMHEHITRVIEHMLEVTEVKEIERARAVAAEQRRRYSPVRRKAHAR